MYGFHSTYLVSFLQESKWQTRKKALTRTDLARDLLQEIAQIRDQGRIILTQIDLARDLLPQAKDQDLTTTVKDLIRDIQLSRTNQTRVDLVQDPTNLQLHTGLD